MVSNQYLLLHWQIQTHVMLGKHLQDAGCNELNIILLSPSPHCLPVLGKHKLVSEGIGPDNPFGYQHLKWNHHVRTPLGIMLLALKPKGPPSLGAGLILKNTIPKQRAALPRLLKSGCTVAVEIKVNPKWWLEKTAFQQHFPVSLTHEIDNSILAFCASLTLTQKR